MPINLSFQPSAFAIGGAGLMAGNADFLRWQAQQRQQAYQFAVGAAQNAAQMNQARGLAFAQMANGNQQQQAQQNFELQKLPLQAQIESQQQAFQSNLQGQNQTNQALLQGQLHANQSQQDFTEQQQLYSQQGQQAQDLAQAQQEYHSQGQMEVAQYQNQLKEGDQLRAMMQNPFATHLANVQKAQQQGLTFSPEDQQKVSQLKQDIGAMQSSVNSGENTLGTVAPQLKQKIGQLNTMVPNQPPPATTRQKIDQNIVMGVTGPDGQIIPGTEQTPFTVDQKTGTPMVVRGWKQPDFGPEGPSEEDRSLAAEKTRAQSLKNQGLEANVHLKGVEWANKMVNEEAKSSMGMFGIDQMSRPIPGYREQRLDYWKQQYQAMTANTPSGPTAVAPGQQPGGQNPGAPQQGAQNPAVPQQIPPPAPQEPPPQQAQQQPSPQPGEIGQKEVEAHDRMVAQLPPREREMVKKFHAEGNHGAAMAVPVLYEITRQYGPDPLKWPPQVIAIAKQLRDRMPHAA